MRRWMILAVLLASGAPFVWPAFAPSVAAQSFGFLYGAPPRATRQRVTRSRPQPARPIAVIPLPIPRPHFAQDPAVVPVAKPETAPVVTRQTDPKAKTPKEAAPSGATPVVPPADLKPTIAASGATTATSPRKPDDDPLCPDRLKAQSVIADPVGIGPQPDARCTVAEPVKLIGLTLPDRGTIEFPDKPVIACAAAESFVAYVRDLLSPLAKGTFGASVGAVWTGPGLECRSRDHIFGAKLSAHGQGLAVDIAQLKLTDGHAIAVGEPKTPQDQAFESAARAGGCGYFHTVLGPGSDSYHRTHWHFDLEVRGAKGDTKFCH